MANLSPVESSTDMALKDWITRYLPGGADGSTAGASEVGSNLAVAALRDVVVRNGARGLFYDVRDLLGYDAEVQFLANRGYVVLQPNYRGSSGYGTEFAAKGEGQWGRAMQDDLDDGADPVTFDMNKICCVTEKTPRSTASERPASRRASRCTASVLARCRWSAPTRTRRRACSAS